MWGVVLELGVILMFVGVTRELITGDRFRDFLDIDFPEQHGRNSEWMKAKLGRGAFLVGCGLVLVGGLARVL